MKMYIKPTVNKIELSVRENIASLPAGVDKSVSSANIGGQSDVTLTTYNLLAVATSDLGIA